MARELFRRGIRDHRRALAGWCIGVALYATLLAAVFPSIESSPEFSKLIESYPDALKTLFGISGDFTTGPGYLDAELFSLILPLLAIFLAIGSAARTLAGDEDAGRLELVLAYPLRRRNAVLAKGAAVATEVLAFCVASFVALIVLSAIFGLDLRVARLVTAVAAVGILGLFHGWLALAVAGLAPSRALAIGVPAAVAAAGYLVGGLEELAGWLHSFRYVSAFWWIGQSPLRTGVSGTGAAVVAAAALVCVAAAALAFERRDLKTP
jgi:ABC-2 type transport system permease protein